MCILPTSLWNGDRGVEGSADPMRTNNERRTPGEVKEEELY